MVREYVGGGILGHLAATLDAAGRAERLRQRRAQSVQRAEWAEADALVNGAAEEAALIVRAALQAAGCHQHKRAWRRSRMANVVSRDISPESAASVYREFPELRTLEGVQAVVVRAARGEKPALTAVRALLTRDWAVDALGGDLPRLIDKALIKRITSGDMAWAEAIEAKLKRVRDDLAGPAPSAVERLLAERAASCWLGLAHFENQFGGAATPAQANSLQKTIDRAHRRYVGTLRALALVRKLAVPAVVVGHAGQVNINAGGAAGSSR